MSLTCGISSHWQVADENENGHLLLRDGSLFCPEHIRHGMTLQDMRCFLLILVGPAPKLLLNGKCADQAAAVPHCGQVSGYPQGHMQLPGES